MGSKPIMNYVTALVTALQRAETVQVLARGRSISNAVDAVEITKRSFLTDIVVDNITIGTEVLVEGDKRRNISKIAILVSLKKEE